MKNKILIVVVAAALAVAGGLLVQHRTREAADADEVQAARIANEQVLQALADMEASGTFTDEQEELCRVLLTSDSLLLRLNGSSMLEPAIAYDPESASRIFALLEEWKPRSDEEQEIRDRKPSKLYKRLETGPGPPR